MNIVIPVKPVPVICVLGLIAAATTCAALVANRSAGEARAEAENARREIIEMRATAEQVLAKTEMERRIGVARAEEDRNAAVRRAGQAEESAQEARIETQLAKEETASLRREFAVTRAALEKRVSSANEAASVARVDFESTLAAERYRAGLDINAARTRAESAENKAAHADRYARDQTIAAAAAQARAAQAERDAANTRAQVVVVQNDTPPQQVPIYIQPAVCPAPTYQVVTRPTPVASVNRIVEGGGKNYPERKTTPINNGRL
jgi:hypothetical protein